MAAVASSSSSSSALDPSCSRKHDVFLSFRGEDTRHNFTSHLYAALGRENILAYIDDNLNRGEEISSALLTAIEESKLSVVIFSKNYASSRWCLDELVHIMKCEREKEHVVLPVFVGIDPSDVRHQKGSYAGAFVKHETCYQNGTNNRVEEWKKALTAAANLSGFDSQHKSESKLVEEIVNGVLDKLCIISKIRSAPDFTGLVGMKKHFEKMESLLHLGYSDVRIIGIWGMGGIGKTTLAEIVYNQFYSQFEGYFFATFRDVSDVFEQYQLKEKLISTLLKDKSLYPDTRSAFANDRLRQRKVLVVLDNVNELKQLECLFGAHFRNGDFQHQKGRFGVGTRIILTSRDRKVLVSTADEIYEVEQLNFDEALKLFFWKAFGGDSPRIDFLELSTKVVCYAQGNPLALDVLGSHLHSRSLREWDSTLKKLEKAPDGKIDKALKVSYDALDDETKTIFLEIACCLAWGDRDVVEEVLGDDFHIGINLLIEKSLITVKYRNKIWVHDLLQHMAWKIVRKERKELQQHGRLYNVQDVYDVLKNNDGSPTIEVLFLDISKIPKDICLRSDVFEDMCNLRLLKIISRSRYSGNCDSKSIYISHGLDCLPNSLKYLEWSHFPLKSLPSNFKPSNLVKLDMYNSKLKELAPEIVNFGNLKEINLSNSKELIKLPDLAQAPKLKCINLTACKNLRRLPDMPANISSIVLFLSGIEALPSSFGSLENIKFLSLQECERLKSLPNLPRNIQTLLLNGCPRLENLPSGIVKVKSLNMLRLSYYKRLKILPEISEIMQHLEDLSLEGTGIQELCPTTQNLIVLCLLNSRNYGSPNFDPECLDNSSHLSNCTKLGCFPSVLLGLNLSFLQLGSCNIQEIPDWLCSLNSLNIIDLSENAFERIPSSIRKLDKLYHLNVSGCKKLRHLPELPPSIRTVNASECTLLHTVDTLKVLLIGTLSLAELEFPNLYEFTFSNCLEMEKSARDSILSYFLSAVHNQMNISSWNQHMAVPTCYPGDEIPEWFSHQWEGSSTTVTLPINCLNNNFLGFATCIVLEVEDSFDLGYHWSTSTKLSFQSNNGEEYYDSNLSFRASIFLNSDHVLMWCNYDPKIKFYLMNLDSIEASFDCTFITDSDENIKVKRCGIRMIYGQVGEEENPISQEDYTIEEEISQELNLSIGSEEIIISRQHDSSNMELQRLENNPRTEFSTVVDGLCPDSSLSTGSLQKIKRFNICGCLPFLSIFIEWKWSK